MVVQKVLKEHEAPQLWPSRSAADVEDEALLEYEEKKDHPTEKDFKVKAQA